MDVSRWVIAGSGASDGARRDVMADAFQSELRDADAGKLVGREPDVQARAEPERQSDLWQPEPVAEPYTPAEGQSAAQ